MNTQNIKGTFAKYVSLNVIGMIDLSCYILADTFFIAQGVGANGLTALNLVIPIYSLINGIGLMLGMGGATRFAISKLNKAYTLSALGVAGASSVFLLAGIFFTSPIVVALGADSHTLPHASMYLKIILCFAPMFMLNNVVICFVRNDGNPRLSMMAMLLGSLSNIVLDYVFIFPFGMGMFGAALATGIAPVVSLMILSWHFIKKKNTFHLLKKLPSIKGLLDIMHLGASALITELSSGIVIIAFNVIILKLAGNIGVAAYGVIANIALIVIAVFTGIAQGMQPIISKYYGEGNSEYVNKILKYGITTSVAVALFVYALTFTFAQPIVSAFNRDADLQLAQIAINGLRIYFTAFAFAGVNILCAAYFSAIAMAKNAFIISVLRGFAIIVPAAFVLSALLGINGVWLAMTVSETLVLGVTVFMLLKKSKNR